SRPSPRGIGIAQRTIDASHMRPACGRGLSAYALEFANSPRRETALSRQRAPGARRTVPKGGSATNLEILFMATPNDGRGRQPQAEKDLSLDDITIVDQSLLKRAVG